MAPFKPAILIPCYNHGSTIQAVVDALSNYGVRIYIVNDGSDEKTVAELNRVERSSLFVQVLHLEQNQGKGAAVCHGFAHLIRDGFTHAVQIDADGQHNFDDIPAVLNMAQDSPDRMILGYPVYDESVPKSRLHGRKISNFWIAIDSLSRDIQDALCGFRCYPLAAVEKVMKKYTIGARMTFDPSIALYLSWEGVQSLNFPTKVHYPENGISHFRMLEDNLAFSWFFFTHFWKMITRIPALLFRRVGRSRSARWNDLPERGSIAGLKITMHLYNLLGPTLTRSIALIPLTYFFLTSATARKASKEYLQKVSNANGQATKPGIALQYRHFFSFANAMIDRLGLFLGKGKRFELHWHGRELIDSYLDKKQGVMLIGAHVGSFELIRLLADERDSEKVHALMYTKQAKMMQELFRQTRGAADLSVIPLENFDIEQMLRMRDLIAKGEHIGVLADRPAAAAHERVELVDFLGSKAPFPVGPWQLASFLKAPTLLMFGIRTGKDRYDLFCEELHIATKANGKIDPAATAQAYAQRLEHYCRKYPLQWFNFYDFWQERNG